MLNEIETDTAICGFELQASSFLNFCLHLIRLLADDRVELDTLLLIEMPSLRMYDGKRFLPHLDTFFAFLLREWSKWK